MTAKFLKWNNDVEEYYSDEYTVHDQADDLAEESEEEANKFWRKRDPQIEAKKKAKAEKRALRAIKWLFSQAESWQLARGGITPPVKS